MAALAQLAAEVDAAGPLNLEAVRAIRAGAERIHENRLIALADAALRELLGGSEIPMTHPTPATRTDADAVHCMRQYGGTFIKRLADCWLAADPINQARLKQAFAEDFERYRDHAARVAKGPGHYVDMARDLAALPRTMEQHVADGEGRN